MVRNVLRVTLRSKWHLHNACCIQSLALTSKIFQIHGNCYNNQKENLQILPFQKLEPLNGFAWKQTPTIIRIIYDTFSVCCLILSAVIVKILCSVCVVQRILICKEASNLSCQISVEREKVEHLPLKSGGIEAESTSCTSHFFYSTVLG